MEAVIIIGGPQKGTRFRPLSLELPKPLFPIAGYPIIYHLIESCCRNKEINSINIIGFYHPQDDIAKAVTTLQREFKIPISYLPEYKPLGTAGGLFHFRDRLMASDPKAILFVNGDICADLPLKELIKFFEDLPKGSSILLASEATEKQSLEYGCIVEDPSSHKVLHYVEKPETFVSSTISCGAYLFDSSIFEVLSESYKTARSCNNQNDCLDMEKYVLPRLVADGRLFAFNTEKFWGSIKTVGSVLFANRQYLNLYHEYHEDRLAKNRENQPEIIGDVYIHPKAKVDATAVLGPNVSIGENVVVGKGARIRESIVLQNCVIGAHACILYSVIGSDCNIGLWTRIEGTPNEPDPNTPFAKIEAFDLFVDGVLNPTITVIGNNVKVADEIIVRNAIVLPHKELNACCKNQIVL